MHGGTAPALPLPADDDHVGVLLADNEEHKRKLSQITITSGNKAFIDEIGGKMKKPMINLEDVEFQPRPPYFIYECLVA